MSHRYRPLRIRTEYLDDDEEGGEQGEQEIEGEIEDINEEGEDFEEYDMGRIDFHCFFDFGFKEFDDLVLFNNEGEELDAFDFVEQMEGEEEMEGEEVDGKKMSLYFSE